MLQQWRQQAELYGIDPMKVKIEKEQDGGELGADDEIKALQMEIVRRTTSDDHTNGDSSNNGNNKNHKIVKEDELVDHLNKGWSLVKEINGDKFLIMKN